MRQAETRVLTPVYPRRLRGEVEISCVETIVLFSYLKALARGLRAIEPGLKGLAALADLETRQGQVLFEREASRRPILQ